jgi:predicted transposase YbfD/YdcC
LRVPDKTNEIPCLRDLLEELDITGTVVTADALHTQTETARFLVEDKKAHYVLTVKANQPTLYANCRALPWKRATTKYYDRSRGHGRTETRVVQVLTVSHPVPESRTDPAPIQLQPERSVNPLET